MCLVLFELDEKAMGTAAVTQERIADQAEKVGKLEHILVASTAVLLPDRAQELFIEDEVKQLQHTARQRRAFHQLPCERVHA